MINIIDKSSKCLYLTILKEADDKIVDRTKIYTAIINNDIDNFRESCQQLMDFYPKFNQELEELNRTLDLLKQTRNLFVKGYHYLRFRRLNHRFHQHDVIIKALKLRFIILLFTTQRHFELLNPYVQLNFNSNISNESSEKTQTQLDEFIKLTENPDFFDQNFVIQLRRQINEAITLTHIQEELENNQSKFSTK